jgi:hypothetical protein
MTPTKNNKRGDRRARQNKSSGTRQSVSVTNSHFPQQFKSNVELKHRFRFQASTAGSYSIARSQILNLLCESSGTAAAYRIMSGAKLNRVEVFGVAGGGTNDYSASTVSLEWLSNLGPTSETSDTGNAMNPPHIVCSPPPQSLASFWSITGQNESEILFTVTVAIGGVIDIWLSAVLFDGETPVSATVTSFGTLGQLYALPLDQSAGVGNLVPVSYNSIK